MPGKTLDLSEILVPDQLGVTIANEYVRYTNLRASKVEQWMEIRKYLYATDTTQTTNNKLPWKNKTTIPKMTQIADNLRSNYLAAMFPKRKWLDWLADNEKDDDLTKRKAILAYATWMISQPQFKFEIAKCVDDYVHYGNTIATVEWVDQRVERDGKIQTGYVGPVPRRISPHDIVFNPTAPTFVEAPKIIRSLISLGELKKKLDSLTSDENIEAYKSLWDYLIGIREGMRQSPEEVAVKDAHYQMDGFSSYRDYLCSDYAEILTFYGDLFDWEKKELLQNHVIMVVDRHKVISKKPNPSYFGYPPIFHVGWRPRQDNLWAMGPLDNLVGMQYRLDHVENLKADVFDLIAFPVLKIKGFVNNFDWEPMARIVCDNDSDVEMLAPPFQVLQANNEIQYLVGMMEEMAGSPKEAMGFRTPGEKTAYEVQRLENAASRIFQNKIMQFEEQFIEPLLNAMIEMARRNLNGVQEITVLNDDFKIQEFLSLTADDLVGAGRLRPVAARHFAERAELVQNLTNLYASGIGQDPAVMVHFSGISTAKALEDLLDLHDYGIVQENVRLYEAEDAKRLAAAGEEQTQMQIMTPSGMTPDDADTPFPTDIPA